MKVPKPKKPSKNKWTTEDDELLIGGYNLHKTDWQKIHACIPTKTLKQVHHKIVELRKLERLEPGSTGIDREMLKYVMPKLDL